ncbi:MAG: hypothetical protein M0Q90_09675 [Bacteroidales bacterium]|nr:hypothetical protein [Bacteroidales bacterium]
MTRFQNKYRIASARAQWWNYGWNAAYYITICTQNREHFFGEIADKKMNLSETGVIADILWNTMRQHHKFVELGDFVVMPNHIHGILILDKPDGGNENGVDDGGIGGGGGGHDGIGDDGIGDDVETGHALSLRQQQQQQQRQQRQQQQQQPSIQPQTIGQKRFQNIGKNTVSSIIGSYKSAVTKHANRLGFPNGWQTRFYDHIIRDDAEYQRISNYIIDNPANWKEDKFYTD